METCSASLIHSFIVAHSVIQIGNKYSSRRTQSNGVPQGSVLNATLLSVAINGIGDRIDPSVTRFLLVVDPQVRT